MWVLESITLCNNYHPIELPAKQGDNVLGSVRPSTCTSVCLSVHPSVCLSLCQSVRSSAPPLMAELFNLGHRYWVDLDLG